MYQLVFDPSTSSLVPLTPLPDGVLPGDLTFAGPYPLLVVVIFVVCGVVELLGGGLVRLMMLIVGAYPKTFCIWINFRLRLLCKAVLSLFFCDVMC